MSEMVELSELDLRYEGYRLRDEAREARLLASIAKRGIEQPLHGVDMPDRRILLDGFKRQRCAKKLGLQCVPYVSIAGEETSGILSLMRQSRDNSPGILEQAKFVTDLLTIHGMDLAEVAEKLARSKSWVSMRSRVLDEISLPVQEILFHGRFPVYCYMYTLRPFRRMNGVSAEDIDRFVKLVAGRRLSVREIERLAHLYFRGAPSMREAIEGGKLTWALDQMKRVPEDELGCNDFERSLLKDLETLQKYMGRVLTKCHDPRLKSRAFHARANLLTGSLRTRLPSFSQAMEEFYDRSGQAQCHLPTASGGDEAPRDQPAIRTQPQHGACDRSRAGGDARQGAQGQDPNPAGASGSAVQGV